MPVYSHSGLHRKPDLPEVDPIERFLGKRVHERI